MYLDCVPVLFFSCCEVHLKIKSVLTNTKIRFTKYEDTPYVKSNLYFLHELYKFVIVSHIKNKQKSIFHIKFLTNRKPDVAAINISNCYYSLQSCLVNFYLQIYNFFFSSLFNITSIYIVELFNIVDYYYYYCLQLFNRFECSALPIQYCVYYITFLLRIEFILF